MTLERRFKPPSSTGWCYGGYCDSSKGVYEYWVQFSDLDFWFCNGKLAANGRVVVRKVRVLTSLPIGLWKVEVWRVTDRCVNLLESDKVRDRLISSGLKKDLVLFRGSLDQVLVEAETRLREICNNLLSELHEGPNLVRTGSDG